MITSINSKQLVNLFIYAEKSVSNRKDIINNLNVYPVPDGDTGTNLSLTLKEITKNLKINNYYTLSELSTIISDSSLMGGRGNSGVILSQFLNGFCSTFKNKKEINIDTFLKSFENGTLEAYRSVTNPFEGTILTIMKAATKEIKDKQNEKDILKILKSVLNKSQFILKKTPDMLPKLKEAGVVDAGGAGFVYILEGFYNSLIKNKEDIFINSDNFTSPPLARTWENYPGLFGTGGLIGIFDFNYQAIKFTLKNIIWLIKKGWLVVKIGGNLLSIKKAFRLIIKLSKELKLQNIKKSNISIHKLIQAWNDKPDEKYCIEVILSDTNISKKEIRNYINRIGGKSNIIIQTNNITKIHFHSLIKKDIRNYFEKIGKIKMFKIDDLYKQQNEFLGKKFESKGNNKTTKVIAIVNGKGFEKLYKSFGGVLTINGGSTMNPSYALLKKATENLNSNTIIILPNNKNIFLVVKKLAENNNRNIKIIPTKDQVQGLSCLLNFNPDLNINSNVEMMSSFLKSIKTFSITMSIKETRIDNKKIIKGEYISLIEGKLLAKDKILDVLVIKSIKLITKNYSLVTIYYGQDIDKKSVLNLKNKIFNSYRKEVQIYDGGQPFYHYIISME